MSATHVLIDDGRTYVIRDMAAHGEVELIRRYIEQRYDRALPDDELIRHLIDEVGVELLVMRGILRREYRSDY